MIIAFKKVIVALFVSFFVVFLCTGYVTALEKGLLLYLPFEGSLKNQADGAEGEARQVVFAQGKKGQGGLFENGSYLRFSAKGHINFKQGTLELWFKPNWNGDDGGYHYFFAGNIRNSININSIHLSKKKYDGGVILGQIDGPEKNGVAAGEASVPKDNFSSSGVISWRKGEWHFLALTWDDTKSTIKLYIDGFLIATNNTVKKNAFPNRYEPYIIIGSSIDELFFADGVIDELKIWDFPKNDLQIAKAAGLWEFDKSPLNKKDSESPKKDRLNLYFVLAGIFSLVALLLFWKRNVLSIIWRKR